MSVPQTISFQVRIEYFRGERPSDKPQIVTHDCETFEEMFPLVVKERRRRSLADRATGAEYRQVLTDLGWERIRECEHAKKSHEAACKGTWFRLDEVK